MPPPLALVDCNNFYASCRRCAILADFTPPELELYS